MINWLSSSCPFFQSCNEGFGHLLVTVPRKNQGDVDIDAGGNKFLDGGKTFRGCWNLDHDVFTIEPFPQPLGFVNRFLGVLSQQWRHLQADIPVQPVGPVVNRLQQVSGHLNVFHRQDLVDLLAAFPLLGQLL